MCDNFLLVCYFHMTPSLVTHSWMSTRFDYSHYWMESNRIVIRPWVTDYDIFHWHHFVFLDWESFLKLFTKQSGKSFKFPLVLFNSPWFHIFFRAGEQNEQMILTYINIVYAYFDISYNCSSALSLRHFRISTAYRYDSNINVWKYEKLETRDILHVFIGGYAMQVFSFQKKKVIYIESWFGIKQNMKWNTSLVLESA